MIRVKVEIAVLTSLVTPSFFFFWEALRPSVGKIWAFPVRETTAPVLGSSTKMVGYQGGKVNLGRVLGPLLQQYAEEQGLTHWVEPFFGSGGVTRYLDLPHRTVSDANVDLMALWQALQDGTFRFPPKRDFTKAAWRRLRDSADDRGTPSAKRAFFGWVTTLPVRYFGTYLERRNGLPMREYARRELARLRRLAQVTFRDVRFLSGRSYLEWWPQLRRGGKLVYCDPPYPGTTPYWDVHARSGTRFDHDLFWRTLVRWGRAGNHVFVSTNEPPRHDRSRWLLVWQQHFHRRFRRGKGRHGGQTQSREPQPGTTEHGYSREEYLWLYPGRLVSKRR